MEFVFILLTILGLSLFEVITSIDNAVINAQVLSGMAQKSRRWFLTWGFFSSVIAVRGLFPLFVLWIANPSIGIIGAFTATFSGDPKVAVALEHSSSLLLIAGGIFLVFLFFNWLFLEPKHFGLRGERFFQKQGSWFFATVSIILLLLVWLALKKDPMMAFAAVLGSTAFFIIHGFQKYAEEQEQQLVKAEGSPASDISKILYLEVLDATFSIDGVVGAFAFTLSIPLILLGNGLGAFVLRRLTVSNIDRIKKYKYLKNGAMYSILFLGIIMILNSFGFRVGTWVSPSITVLTVGYFFYKSTSS